MKERGWNDIKTGSERLGHYNTCDHVRNNERKYPFCCRTNKILWLQSTRFLVPRDPWELREMNCEDTLDLGKVFKTCGIHLLASFCPEAVLADITYP